MSDGPSINTYRGFAEGLSTTHSTTFPGITWNLERHELIGVIKMFKGEKPVDAAYAYDAEELMHYLKPHVLKKGKKPAEVTKRKRLGMRKPASHLRR